jgi:enamine deaminase RidA (YjgF/YER057c/UK114 family)
MKDRETSPQAQATVTRPWLLPIVTGAIACLLAYPLARRSIILSDEGVMLAQAIEIARGKVLYRDLDAFVAPGIWYLLAATFSVFPPSVLLGRVIMLLGFGLTTVLSVRIALRFAPPACALMTAVGLMVAYVWAFPSWTFAFYSPFAVLFAIAALDRFLAWRSGQHKRDLFLTGVLIGLSIGFKQNYGALTFLGVLVTLPVTHVGTLAELPQAMRRSARDAGWVILGVFLVVGSITAFFAGQGALRPLWKLTVLHLASFGARQDIPYLPLSALWQKLLLVGADRLTYGAVPLYAVGKPADLLGPATSSLGVTERLHVLLYWLAPATILTGLALAMKPLLRSKEPDGDLAAVAIVGGALFLGVFPRADFAHLMNVYQPVVLMVALLLYRTVAWARPSYGPPLVRGDQGGMHPTCGESFRFARILSLSSTVTLCRWLSVFVCLALVGVYALVAMFWYNRIRVQYDHPLKSERAGILVHAMEGDSLDAQVAFLRSVTMEDEPVLTVPDMSMLNFLAARPAPGRYYNLYEHHIAEDEGAGVVDEAERSAVRWVVTRYDDFFSDRVPLRRYAPRLWRYLDTQFEIVEVEADNRALFLKRRTGAATKQTITPVLGACAPPQENPHSQSIRHHLLFDALDQCVPLYSGAARPFPERRCIVTIPEGGELSLGVGYRRLETAAIEPGTELTAEVWLLPRNQVVQKNTIAIVPRGMEERYTVSHIAPGVLVNQTLHISGQLGLGPDGELPRDDRAQMVNAFENVQRVLEAAGASWADVVELQSFHVGLKKHLPTFTQVKGQYLTAPAVAQTSVGVVELGVPGAIVELRARAVVPAGRAKERLHARASAIEKTSSHDPAGGHQLLAERLPVLPKNEWIAPRWQPHRLDLSRYAGETVTLVFRAALRGAVDLDPTELRPLCLEWREPRIESPLGPIP